MKNLKISNTLSFPLETATSTISILAIRGAGKTYTGSVIAEEMIGAQVQTVIIDPTGVWWGLRSSANGKSAGLPVIVMGGNHGDVPIEPTAGEVVAEFIVESGASVILDLCLMRKGRQKTFMTHFAEHLYHLKARTKYQTPLHMIMDEADRFAPQKPRPEFARLLGAIEDIVRLGRSRGFGITMITQRSAVLNKDVLTQIETLIVLRTTSPQDRKAIGEWVKENSTEEELAAVMKGLSSMPNGEAWIWSPAFLKTLKKVQIRTRHTFNSSATPKIGQIRIEPKKRAAVDLESLKGKIAETIENVKANDPSELRKQIATLQRDLNAESRKAPPAAPEPKVVEVPVINQKDIKRLQEISDGFFTVSKEAKTIMDRVEKTLEYRGNEKPKIKAEFTISSQLMAAVKAPPSTAPTRVNGDLTHPRQRIINTLAWFESIRISPLDRGILAYMSDQSPKSSGYTNNLGALRTEGYITYPMGGQVALADAGRAIAEPQESPVTTEHLQGMILSKLAAPRKRIVKILIATYPESMTREQLATMSMQSVKSSGFTNNLGALRSLKLIDYSGPGMVVASEKLFLN